MRYESRELYLAPVVMLIAIVIGLMAALVGGRAWYALSWLAMGVPLVVIARYLLRARGLLSSVGTRGNSSSPLP